jgi:hypothetical protein
MSVSFAQDIRPLFRTDDIEHMSPYGVQLDNYTYMSDPGQHHKNAQAVQDFLTGKRKPRMPIGGPFWTAEELDLYDRWMTGGYLP